MAKQVVERAVARQAPAVAGDVGLDEAGPDQALLGVLDVAFAEAGGQRRRVRRQRLGGGKLLQPALGGQVVVEAAQVPLDRSPADL